MPFAHPPSGRLLILSLLVFLLAFGHGSVRCEPDEELRDEDIIRPDGVHILDGSYVLDVGELRVNIYTFPNPATREALAEFQKQPPSHSDPTGERIMFVNLPAASNTIRIYTASGDLVQTLYHDGHSQGGSTAWNLVSRNGQEIVSGIYLYIVQSDDGRFEDFQGRFTVVR